MYGVKTTPRLLILASGSKGAAGGLQLVVHRLVFNLNVVGGAGFAVNVVIDAAAYIAADAAKVAAVAMSVFHAYSLRVFFAGQQRPTLLF